MATIDDKNREDFPQNTGPLSLYQWKNKVVVAAVGNRGVVQTHDQIVNAQKFKLMQRVFGPSFVFLRLGFAAFPGRPRDRAMKLNYHKAFKGEYPKMELDYAVLQLAEGPLPLPDTLSAQAGNDNTILLSWTPPTHTNTSRQASSQTSTAKNQSDTTNLQASSDLLMVSLYCPVFRQAIVYPELACRADATATIVVDPEWAGIPFHLYAACYNKNSSLASNSTYLGCFTLQCDNPVPFNPANRYKPRIRKPAQKKEGTNFDIVGLSGRVGPINIFTDKRGRVIARANPAKRTTPPTQGEKMNMSRFSLMSHFLSKVRVFYTIGFDGHKSRTHVRSAAMSANLRKEVVGNGPNFAIDYLAVQLSDGPLAAPRVTKARREKNTALFSWASDGDNGISSPDDTLLVAVYNTERDEAVVSQTMAKRSEGKAAVPLPEGWNDNGCIAYLAFHNVDNNMCSPTSALAI